MCWGIPKGTPKHGDEVAGGRIAQGVGDNGDRFSAREHFERMGKPGLLTLLRKAQARFRRDHSPEAPRGYGTPRCPRLQRARIVRLLEDRMGDANQPWIGRHGQMQWLVRRALDLVQQDLDDPLLWRGQMILRRPGYGPPNQRPHQVADADDAGPFGQLPARLG